MIKKIGVFGLLCLFVFVFAGAVSATETTITVTTLPLHKMFITVSEPINDFKAIKIFPLDTGISGINSVVFSSDKFQTFNVSVKVKRDDETIFYKHFGTFPAGTPINLTLLDETGTVISLTGNSSKSNSTPQVAAPSAQNSSPSQISTPLQNQTNTSGGSITGNAITTPSPTTTNSISPQETTTKSKSLFSNFFFYIFLGIIVLAIIGFLLLKTGSSTGTPSFKPVNLGGPFIASSTEKKLAYAEKREEESHAEVESLREQRVKELKTKITEEKRELRSLRPKRHIDIEPIKHKDSKYKGMRI